MSWHGVLHTVAPVVASLALVAACFVFARRFVGLSMRGWTAYWVVSLGLSSATSPAGDFRLMLLGGVVIWLWASVIAAQLLRARPPKGQMSTASVGLSVATGRRAEPAPHFARLTDHVTHFRSSHKVTRTEKMAKNKKDPEAVDEYLARLPDDERNALEELRRLIRASVPDVQERISYGSTIIFALQRDLVGCGAQKQHLSFFTMSPPLAKAMKGEINKTHKSSGATIHFSPDSPLPTKLSIEDCSALPK